ncbi:MAG: class I SAM-dependent methyltransferase [Bdellovibrionaceae bacterium]|nr:class I SAM-dependent methyltransferase [Pseudobdellovibrionaceae bacterium]
MNEHFEKRIPVFIVLGFRESGLKQLKAFIDLLWETNEELNLISRKMTYQELIDNHVIDCLLPLSKFPKNVKRVADFGTGGGLPGIIYAIHFSEIKFNLFEKSVLKQAFLKRCKAITNNITVESDIPLKLQDVNLVIARAFKAVDVILDMSRAYYEGGGKYFLLKARREKIDEELVETQKKFKDVKVQIETLKSPVLEVERHLVLIN